MFTRVHDLLRAGVSRSSRCSIRRAPAIRSPAASWGISRAAATCPKQTCGARSSTARRWDRSRSRSFRSNGLLEITPQDIKRRVAEFYRLTSFEQDRPSERRAGLPNGGRRHRRGRRVEAPHQGARAVDAHRRARAESSADSAECFDVPTDVPKPVLVSSADGVGTKLKVAIEAGRHDTVGHDLVNHCVNDILVQGATPLFFCDYVAFGALEVRVRRRRSVAGVAAGCRENGCARCSAAKPPRCPGVIHTAGLRSRRVHRRVRGRGRTFWARSACQNGDVSRSASRAADCTPMVSRWLGASCLSRNGARTDDAISRRSTDLSGDVPPAVHRSYLSPMNAPLSKSLHAMAHITGGGTPGNLNRKPCHRDDRRSSRNDQELAGSETCSSDLLWLARRCSTPRGCSEPSTWSGHGGDRGRVPARRSAGCARGQRRRGRTRADWELSRPDPAKSACLVRVV